MCKQLTMPRASCSGRHTSICVINSCSTKFHSMCNWGNTTFAQYWNSYNYFSLTRGWTKPVFIHHRRVFVFFLSSALLLYYKCKCLFNVSVFWSESTSQQVLICIIANHNSVVGTRWLLNFMNSEYSIGLKAEHFKIFNSVTYWMTSTFGTDFRPVQQF